MVSRGAMDAGILPVKRLDRAKGRLGVFFDDRARVAIAGVLLERAFAVLGGSDFLSWWIVTDDDGVDERARRLGFGVVRDPGVGLNEALRVGIRDVVRAGAASVTIVPADLPLAEPEDLVDVVDTGATSDVVVVPARTGGGTNALYLRPPALIEPSFGARSLAAHVGAAEERGARCSILPLPRMELDIDTPEDLELLMEGGGGATAAIVAALGSGAGRGPKGIS
jgi:2-phospho-L-lactate guanylyltransferase